MKVKCIELRDAYGDRVARSTWAKIGGIYHILSIEIDRGQTKLRLVGEEPTPALFEVEMFELVSSVIPPTWVISSPAPGCLSLEPASWARVGFWEEYFDGEPEAVATFEQERERIVMSGR